MTKDELVSKINEIQRKTQRWKLTGEQLGVSGGMAFRIAQQGYEPHDNHIRVTLGLPAMIPAPACPKCGVVHVAKRCTATNKPRARWERVMGHEGWRAV